MRGDDGRVAAVAARHVTVSYGSRPVLWDADARFPQGALSAVVGPNGSGKSTLLKACMGLVPLDTGSVAILGRPASTALERVAYVPQAEEVDWDFPVTVREVVEMGRYRSVGWIGRLKPADRDAVSVALERVGMTRYADRQIGRLSGGQRKRVFIARALAQDAEVLMLDEPFAGVDARTEGEILGLLATLRDRRGRSVVVVHHDLATVRSAFDHVVLLNTRVVAEGPPAEALRPEALREAYGAAYAVPSGKPEEHPWVP